MVVVPFNESEVSGEPVRICLNLAQFLRALEQRFLEFEVRGPDKPLVARDGERIYLSMPLPAHAALKPRPEDAPVAEPAEPSHAIVRLPSQAVAVPVGERLEPYHSDSFDVLTEAEGLKDGLFMVATHAGRILRFLRQVCTSQRVTQIVRTSLLSLFDRPVSGEKSA